ncbi:MAG: MFS transporter [Coriobacteriia bacterium]|nr:MFS transporter [Coriobacteriia bacterium]MBN2839825.1 MFS transporter [Coriobacteriia bacterium]
MMGLVSLLTDASSEMVYPVLPLFLANVLGAPVAAIGLIESLAEAAASFTKVGSGWLSDRVGRRKPLIALGYTMSNMAKPLLALSATWPAVLALRLTDRLGKGVRTAPRDALIAESAERGERGRAFGAHRALDTLGAAIGPLVAWAVLTLSPDAYRTVFLVSTIPGSLAIVVVLFAVRDAGRERGGIPSAPSLRGFSKPLAVFTAISGVFALANSSDALLILRAQDLGAAPAVIPLMYVVFNLAGALLSGPFGTHSDTVGRRRLLVFGFGGYALVYLGFALARSAVSPWLLFALYGIPYAATEGMTRAYVCDLAGPERRGTVLGAYTFVLGLAALPSSALAGVLWDTVSHSAPFVFSAVLMGAAALALLVTGSWLDAQRSGDLCGARS